MEIIGVNRNRLRNAIARDSRRFAAVFPEGFKKEYREYTQRKDKESLVISTMGSTASLFIFADS